VATAAGRIGSNVTASEELCGAAVPLDLQHPKRIFTAMMNIPRRAQPTLPSLQCLPNGRGLSPLVPLSPIQGVTAPATAVASPTQRSAGNASLRFAPEELNQRLQSSLDLAEVMAAAPPATPAMCAAEELRLREELCVELKEALCQRGVSATDAALERAAVCTEQLLRSATGPISAEPLLTLLLAECCSPAAAQLELSGDATALLIAAADYANAAEQGQLVQQQQAAAPPLAGALSARQAAVLAAVAQVWRDVSGIVDRADKTLQERGSGVTLTRTGTLH
jgi:hypothetical protein